jgi:hypothetical protein
VVAIKRNRWSQSTGLRTFAAIDGRISVEPLGVIPIKGRGELALYRCRGGVHGGFKDRG